MTRPISIDGFKAPPHTDRGSAPQLQWIKIDELRVDDAYQRSIRDQGRRNVQRIANDFRWSHFAPVIVAPIEGGLYAIVDGQHRTTAAALVGVERVPCQVIIADRETQAAAFVAINGAVTKISPMQLHAAALASGKPDAMLLAEACGIAEVELLRYPIQKSAQKPGQTMSVKAAAACFAQFGRDTFITAMQCMTQTELNQQPGVITGASIRALCTILDKRREWRDAGEDLFQAFEEIDVGETEAKARQQAAMRSGVTTTVIMGEIIEHELTRLMPVTEAAE